MAFDVRRARLNVEVDSRGAVRANRELRNSFADLARSVGSFQSVLGALGLGSFAVLARQATREARAFGRAMGEVSTLLPDARDVGALSDAVRDLSAEFGQAPTDQARALYQIISAGASSSAEAVDLLTAANKLAIGGVTEVETAADGLTSILNAYGGAAGSALDVSDALFVAMRDGKTTVGELAQSIGYVAPIAAQAGVSLEEVLSATAALTKGGMSTAESMRGLRQIIASVVKPTSEARTMAKELGLQFDAAALRSKGFAGFLQILVDATGGSTEQLAQLFGGVEALVPILSLAGGGADDFTEALDDMGRRAGATERAFQRMADTEDYRLRVATASLKDELLGMGVSILRTTVPAMEELATSAENVSNRFGSARTAIGQFSDAIDEFRRTNALTVALNEWVAERFPEITSRQIPALEAAPSLAGGGGLAALGPLGNPAFLAAVSRGLEEVGRDADDTAGRIAGITAEFQKLIDRYRHLVNQPPIQLVDSTGTGRGLDREPNLPGRVEPILPPADFSGFDVGSAGDVTGALYTAGRYLPGRAGDVASSAGALAAALGTGGLVGAIGATGAAFEGLTSLFGSGESAVQRFIRSLDEAMDRLRAEFLIFDVDDPLEQFNRVLETTLAELPDAFDRWLEGVTPENFEERAREFFDWLDTADIEGLRRLGFGPFIDTIQSTFERLAVLENQIHDTANAFRGLTDAVNAPDGLRLSLLEWRASQAGVGVTEPPGGTRANPDDWRPPGRRLPPTSITLYDGAITIVQNPDEDGEALANRVVDALERKALRGSDPLSLVRR